MNNGTSSDIKEMIELYHAEVQLYLWYSGSDFSFHKGKTSAVLARKHQQNALAIMREIIETRENNQ